MTSSDDVQFPITEERNQDMFTFNKLQSQNYDFSFFKKMTQTGQLVLCELSIVEN